MRYLLPKEIRKLPDAVRFSGDECDRLDKEALGMTLEAASVVDLVATVEALAFCFCHGACNGHARRDSLASIPLATRFRPSCLASYSA